HYRKNYPETFDAATNSEVVYCGPHRMQDPLPESDMTVGQALLSPTRTYAPVMHRLLTTHKEKILGLVHCSGGAQTKCLRFGTGVHFIKEDLFPVPPVFREIQRVSGTSTHEMHQVFNMGHRMEIYCSPEYADIILEEIETFGIEAKVVGRTEESRSGNSNHVTVQNLGETLEYSLKV
ncbi:MAG: AIR synthase-related protein, partial [Opitutae bacterium]